MWVGGNSDTFSEKRFRDRVRFLTFMFLAGCTVIMLRLFFLQVIRGGALAQVSESNRTQVIFLRAPRGDFFDRKGRSLVLNRPSWSLMYSVPEKQAPRRQYLQERLAPFLESVPGYWTKRLHAAFQSKQMVRLAEDVPGHVAFVIREMEEMFPGLRVVMEFRRGYPMGILAGHLIGYLGEIDERELRDEVWSERKLGDLIGKIGIEKIHDETLRGEDGGMVIEIDSIGRLKRVIKELPFRKGRSVHLTLDVDVQKVAEEALAASPTGRGAAVAIDPRTGAILVWASAPSFNPMGSMAEGLKDENLPFLDRVYKGQYPPGSVFKIITAIAGFQNGLIRPSERVECIGYVMLKDKTQREKRYRCWTKHGSVDYWKAMAESCDTYFYLLGQKLGSQAISDYAVQFGYGQPAQKTLPGESSGIIPNPIWKRRTGRGGWSTGDTYNMSIGQGYVTSTPLQVAAMMAGLANHGVMRRLYAVDKMVESDGSVSYQATPEVLRTVILNDTTWSMVERSLRAVVTQGTGVSTRIQHLDVHGKTGTSQNPHGDDHAWFAGYAGYPGEDPSIAVAVLVENGGHGGAVAAPIVRKILETALPPRDEMKEGTTQP